jgi:hypothetical protein
MFSPVSRPVRLALLAALITLGGSSTEAANIGVNFSVVRSTQDFAQMESAGRRTHADFGTAVTPPPVYQGGNGPRARAHAFDPNTQFDGSGSGNSASGLPK